MSKSKYRTRTVQTASGATAVQVVCYENNTRKTAKHIVSAKNHDELEILLSSAKQYIAAHEPQLSLFHEPISRVVNFDQIELTSVSCQFARTILFSLAKQCGLGELDSHIGRIDKNTRFIRHRNSALNLEVGTQN